MEGADREVPAEDGDDEGCRASAAFITEATGHDSDQPGARKDSNQARSAYACN